MNSLNFNMVENQIIDWYESLNTSNTVNTLDMRTRIPPFLTYTVNNGYSYKTDSGNTITFNRDQQPIIRELINDEIERLNSIRNNAINVQHLTSRNSNDTMGGKRKRSKRRTSKRTSKRTRTSKRRKAAKTN
jgi:hypothetical protein